jgi:hypothetical protein
MSRRAFLFTWSQAEKLFSYDISHVLEVGSVPLSGLMVVPSAITGKSDVVEFVVPIMGSSGHLRVGFLE